MSINKAQKNVRSTVLWHGEEAAKVRWLTPNDVAQLLADRGQGIQALLEANDAFSLAGIDLDNKEAIADRIMESGPKLVVHLASTMPDLIARLIAVAAEEDDDETVEYIRDNWSLPLQFEALRHIAVQTFAGPEGFRMFVGNVLALGQTVSHLTGQATARSVRAPRGSESGSRASSIPAHSSRPTASPTPQTTQSGS